MPTSGHKAQFGVDTTANPMLIEGRTLNIDSVNRAYRGGLNRTRPAFQLLKTSFSNNKERELFERGSLTSIKGYSGVPPFTSSHIVATVGECVFVGQVFGDTCKMVLLYDKLDPELMFQYPVQAESLLLINNGRTEPIYWNGQQDKVKKVSESRFLYGSGDLSEQKFPIPIGNICIYAHGRLWIATEEGVVYVGDHLYSQGNAVGDEALFRFSESAYPSSGDGFTAPAEWGDLRGMAVISRDPSTNGHGEVIVFHLHGAYSITPLDDRSTWTASNIQQTVFTGVGEGGCSPFSIANINNDILFRSSDNMIRSLRQTVSQNNSGLQSRTISNEVTKYLNYDNDNNIVFSSCGIDDKRLMFSVYHKLEANKDLGGNHRYANGLVVCDFAAGSNTTPDALSWDGLWTGPRPTGITQLQQDTKKRVVISSYDTDGINRLYFLSEFQGDDKLDGVKRQIKSMYVVGNLFDGISTDDKDGITSTTIKNHITYYSDCDERCYLSAAYSSSFSKEWHYLYQEKEIGIENTDCCFLYNLSADSHKSSSAKSVTEITGRKSDTGVSFNLRLELEGTVTINASLLSGSYKLDDMSFSNSSSKCGSEKSNCILCDTYDLFNYQF